MGSCGTDPLFSIVCAWQSPCLDRLAVGRKTVDCKHSRSAACLLVGSWGTFEMHGLVKTHGDVQTMVHLLAVFIELILSEHSETPPGQCSMLLWVGLCHSRDCTDQAGHSTDGMVSLSPFLGIHIYSLLSLFNTSLLIPSCDIIKQAFCLVVGKPVSLLAVDHSEL